MKEPSLSACRGSAVLMLALLTPAGAASAQPTQWNQVQHLGPAARTGSAMVYDSARQVAVLFGGSDDVSHAMLYSDTWEWNGATWTRRAVTGPRLQSGHVMAYDSARGRTVLLGDVGETWEWDGAAWTRRTPDGPPRLSAAAAYDAARGETVVFGGVIGTLEGNQLEYATDTWTWNGSMWTRRATTGPSPRVGGSLAYDASRQVCVLFGGLSGQINGVASGDTWEWNGTTWTQRPVVGPPARYGCGLAYDSDRAVIVLFGGTPVFAPEFADTWEFDGTQWVQRNVSGISARSQFQMTYDGARGRITLFSGNHLSPYQQGAIDPGQPGDTWALQAACSPPTLSLQSSSERTCPGVTLTLTAQGASGPVNYQWQSGRPRVPISGANGPTIVLPVPAVFGAGNTSEYECVVWNTCGSAMTPTFRATRNSYDMDCNGTVDVNDIFTFLQYWFTGDLRADAYTDGIINVSDVFQYISDFFSH